MKVKGNLEIATDISQTQREKGEVKKQSNRNVYNIYKVEFELNM